MTTRSTLPPTAFRACAMRSAVAVCMPSAVGVLPLAAIALIFVASCAAVDVQAVASELAVVPLNVVIPTWFPVAPMPPLFARSVTSWLAAFLAQKMRGHPEGQVGSEPELLLPMLPDLSITSSTSLRTSGTAPHGPPQAADETATER